MPKIPIIMVCYSIPCDNTNKRITFSVIDFLKITLIFNYYACFLDKLKMRLYNYVIDYFLVKKLNSFIDFRWEFVFKFLLVFQLKTICESSTSSKFVNIKKFSPTEQPLFGNSKMSNAVGFSKSVFETSISILVCK